MVALATIWTGSFTAGTGDPFPYLLLTWRDLAVMHPCEFHRMKSLLKPHSKDGDLGYIVVLLVTSGMNIVEDLLDKQSHNRTRP
jgi:hypothetical protein